MSDAGSQPDPAALVRGWLEHSPFASHLGLRLESLGHGEAELALPYEDKLATMGDVVHGGAISSLIDTAAAAAAVGRRGGREGPRDISGVLERIAVDHLPGRAAKQRLGRGPAPGKARFRGVGRLDSGVDVDIRR